MNRVDGQQPIAENFFGMFGAVRTYDGDLASPRSNFMGSQAKPSDVKFGISSRKLAPVTYDVESSELSPIVRFP
jgi:hypothetical protein